MKVHLSRRAFLDAAGSAGLLGLAGCRGFPAILSCRSPNALLSHAAVGTANMALTDLKGLMSHPKLHVTALCDVDSNFLAEAAKLCPGARLYRNAHEMFAVEGNRIDSCNVSTPDHTHADYITDALRRGLDVYGQKPLCRTVAECREVERLAVETGAVTQMGTQIAAHACDRETVEFLRMGAIGAVERVWIFSNRGGQSMADHTWPLRESPVPEALDWKTWLGSAPVRDYAEGCYHPAAWRKWLDFGSSWLGDLGLHLLSPIWIGMELGRTGPLSVDAEVTREAPELERLFWPRNSHVTWHMPGVKASGGKPFCIEWCDGNIVARDAKPEPDDAVFGKDPNAKRLAGTNPAEASMEASYFPPAFFRELYAKTPIGEQPLEGRVVQGSEGWLLSVHCKSSPYVVLRNGTVVPPPKVAVVPSHWHEYVNCCLEGGTPTCSFAWAGRLAEMIVLGNEAMRKIRS